jgi:hypothetical protein
MRTTTRSISAVFALSLLSLAAGCEPLASMDDAQAHDSVTDVTDATDATDATVTDVAVARTTVTSGAPLAHAALLHEGARWIVLGDEVDATLAAPLTVVTASENHQVVTRALTAAELAGTSVTRSVRVYRGARWVCDATLGAPVALAVSEHGYDETGAATDRAPSEVWESGLRVTAAALTTTRGDCADGEWAQDASLEAPRFAVEERATDALAALGYEAIRTSALGRATQEQHDETRASCERGARCPARWTDRDDVSKSATVFRTSDGGRWLFASLRTEESCGEFGVNLSVFARVSEENGSVTLRDARVTDVAWEEPSALIEPAAAAVVGGRAVVPELLFGADRMRENGAGELEIERVFVPVFGCGC